MYLASLRIGFLSGDAKASARLAGITKDMFPIWICLLYIRTYLHPTFLCRVYIYIFIVVLLFH